MEEAMSTFVLPLSDPQGATLDAVGGKGASLAKLSAAGLPVPGGFHLTTAAYNLFVDFNRLQPRILGALQGLETADAARLDAISQQITDYFAQGEIPAQVAREVSEAYAELCKTSSAKGD